MNTEIKKGIKWSGISLCSGITAGLLDKASKSVKDENKEVFLCILKVIALGVAIVTEERAIHCFQESAQAAYTQLTIPKGYCHSIYA